MAPSHIHTKRIEQSKLSFLSFIRVQPSFFSFIGARPFASIRVYIKQFMTKVNSMAWLFL
jgi:hypothetical protein